MGFKGLFGWIRGRGRKDEEEEEDSPQIALAKDMLRRDMERDMENDRNYTPPKRMRKRYITYIPPTEYGLKCVNEKSIFSKSINGKKVVFRVLHIGRFGSKFFTCGKCKGAYRGLHYAGKIGKWVFLCTKCFNTYPDYVEQKIELSEGQKQYISDILKENTP